MITRGRNAINSNVENVENVKSILKPSFKNTARAVLATISDNINNKAVVQESRKDRIFSRHQLTDDQLAQFKTFIKAREALALNASLDQISGVFCDYDGTEFEDNNYLYIQNQEYALLPLEKNFLARQPKVSARMRYILINWLVKLHETNNMVAETLYLTIAIMDRFLQHTESEVNKNNFQLLGVTALFIAAKYEETYPPEIGDLVAYTDYAMEKKHIKEYEAYILNTLGFEINFPIPISFLRRLTTHLCVDRNTHNLAKYFLELTIQEYDLAWLTGNIRAAIAVCLAHTVCTQSTSLEKVWDSGLAGLTGLTFGEIEEYTVLLARVVYRQNSASAYRSIKNKYSNRDVNLNVATLPVLNTTYFEKIARLEFDQDGNPI